MTHPFAGRRMRARGFTLVELLIAMALTLILVYAVAQFYAFVGETVRDGRAQIEMGGNLRQAASRLQQDFAELTVRVGGRIDAGSGMGVLEIVEGIASDSDPAASLAVNAQGVPTGLFDVNGDNKPDGPMLGDCDDILVMTIRSQGDPFVGRWWNSVTGNYQIVQSNLAEVIWFTIFKDTNGNGSWTYDSNLNGVLDSADIPEPRYLVRRQLLIRPDLAVTWPNAPNALPQGQSIYHHNDISCHVVLDGMGNFAGYFTNSLSDLSQRENRCIHQNLYPATLNLNGLRAAQGYMPNTVQLNAALTDVPSIPLYQQGSCSLYSLDGIPQFIGEDKMLSNLLAFDVRVYDPYAVLRADDSTLATAHGVLGPGDPGYAYATANNFPYYLSPAPNNGIGVGAYVDLWYNRAFRNLPPAVLQNSAYSWAPNSTLPPPPDPQWPPITVNQRATVANGPAIWDTWTTAYEKDGLNQLPDGSNLVLPYNLASVDWMVDGLDNGTMAIPPSGGVDDPSESDTRMPYPSWVGDNGVDDNGDGTVDENAERNYAQNPPTMLRGIEVRIRIYEPGTRQTRQVTVATDFIPE